MAMPMHMPMPIAMTSGGEIADRGPDRELAITYRDFENCYFRVSLGSV